MEKSSHNPQVLQKGSQLGCKQTPGTKHWLCALGCCVQSGHLLLAREIGLGGGMDSLELRWVHAEQPDCCEISTFAL